MKALSIGLVVFAMAVLLGAGCRTDSASRDCPKCHMPPECCTCNMAR